MTSRNTLRQFATSPPASGKSGGKSSRDTFDEEVRISQVFKKFDTKRLRDGNAVDDALREIIWENGFKIPVAPVKNKMNMYLIGSQKMVVQMRHDLPHVRVGQKYEPFKDYVQRFQKHF